MKHTPICCHPALQAWLEKGESSLRHKVWAWLSWQQLRHEFSGSGEGAESVLLGKRTVNHPERSLCQTGFLDVTQFSQFISALCWPT